MPHKDSESLDDSLGTQEWLRIQNAVKAPLPKPQPASKHSARDRRQQLRQNGDSTKTPDLLEAPHENLTGQDGSPLQHDSLLDAGELGLETDHKGDGRAGQTAVAIQKRIKMGNTQGDDTQSNEEDLYSLFRHNKAFPVKHAGATEDNATARTYATNDTGHVDFFKDIGEDDLVEVEPLDEEGSADELAGGAETQGTLNLTSPARMSPITPGAALRRLVASPVALERTPMQDLSTLFTLKSNAKLMGASQLFAHTQDTGSPFRTIATSEPIYVRPSPDFREAMSSQAESSPVMLRRGLGRRAATEPRGDYIPMIESQQRRSVVVDDDLSVSESDDRDELDEDSAERRAKRRRERDRRKDRVLNVGLHAPISPRKTNVRSKPSLPLARSFPDRLTPAHARKARDVIVISDNPSHGEREDASEEDSADEYDELSQQIIPSDRAAENSARRSRSTHRKELQDFRISHSPSPVASKGDSHGGDEDIELPELPPDELEQPRKTDLSYKRAETVAVINSQLEKGSNGSSVPSRAILPSSIDSRLFISQSQTISTTVTRIQQAELSGNRIHSSALHSSSLPSPDKLYHAKPVTRAEIGSSPPANIRRINPDADELSLLQETVSQEPANFDDTEAGTTNTHAPQLSNSQPNLSGTYAPPLPRRRITYSIPDTSPMATPKSQEINLANMRPISPVNDAQQPSTNVLNPELAELQMPPAGTNSNLVFDTAQTHLSPSPSKKQPIHRQESLHFGNMADIAGPFRSSDSTENIDIDLNILDDDDNELLAALSGSSPPMPIKRRRITYGRSMRTPADVSREQPSPTPPQARSSKGILGSSPLKQHSTQPVTSSALAAERSEEISSIKSVSKTVHKQQVIRTEIAETPQASLPKAVAKPSRRVAVQSLTKTLQVSAMGTKSLRDNSAAEAPAMSTPRMPEFAAEAPNDLDEVCAPRRVLARFMDGKMAFYPATCLGFSSSSAKALRVRFDDGSEDDVLGHLVKSLNLRIDDVVKVDLPKMRKETFVVHGFKDRMNSKALQAKKYPEIDTRGHLTVLLVVKSRMSLPRDASTSPQVVEVPITNIYMTSAMWIHFKHRDYTHPTKTSSTAGRPHTPVSLISAPTTPSSRSRRTNAAAAHPTVPKRTASAEATSGLFDNMAFAITYGSNHDNDKSHINQLILKQGGRVLAEGYDELFSYSASTNVSPSKSPHRTVNTEETTFSLASTAAELGFTALIADTHSRRAKYMQALALNIPCLSGRWIVDCCDQQAILPWNRYLLAAGESSYLDTVRSRTFPPYQSYDAMDRMSQLQHTIDNRPRMLANKNVMLVMGKGKAEEKRKAYVFLTYALGAKRVARVRDITAAKRMLEDDGDWDWVYVDDAKVDEARAELLNEKKVGTIRLKKRKRESTFVDELGPDVVASKLKVVGDEFVIQSLIFGALVEEM